MRVHEGLIQIEKDGFLVRESGRREGFLRWGGGRLRDQINNFHGFLQEPESMALSANWGVENGEFGEDFEEATLAGPNGVVDGGDDN